MGSSERRHPGQILTPHARMRFLAEIREHGNVSRAARVIGISRRTAYSVRETDSEFRDDWDEARAEGLDKLEAEARRRAEQGVLKPVYQKGRHVGVVREYSDTLMSLLLKANLPQKYREAVAHEHRFPERPKSCEFIPTKEEQEQLENGLEIDKVLH